MVYVADTADASAPAPMTTPSPPREWRRQWVAKHPPVVENPHVAESVPVVRVNVMAVADSTVTTEGSMSEKMSSGVAAMVCMVPTFTCSTQSVPPLARQQSLITLEGAEETQAYHALSEVPAPVDGSTWECG